MRGDHPDPSVVKVGDDYWASATTSNWFPAYPLLKSKDLVHWEKRGYVFNVVPQWADYYFWAPEITYDNGKVYMYYAAHKKNGNLCLAVASADKPEGPYTDHGPLMCQEVGSIDAFPMRDEQGKLFMIWKEDGNSVKKPTPIWIQEMNEERTALLGEKKELFRNTENWEGNLVEGVSMIKKGEYYYAFYAAGGCCGRECTYVTGIARSKNLMGPWEKYSKNPVLTGEEEWKCPGHGTAIEKDGKYYFLYHAYDDSSNVYTGRQGLLREFRFTNDDWIEFVKDNAPDVLQESLTDDFKGKKLRDHWQWSIFHPIDFKQRRGKLKVKASERRSGSYLGIKTLSGSYTATVQIKRRGSSATSGLGIIGDDENTVSVLYSDNTLKLVQLKEGKETVLRTEQLNARRKLHIRAEVKGGKNFRFLYSTDGKIFRILNEQDVDGSYLPPWDRALRVGIISKGDASAKAVFDKFELVNR
jgi:beta-xylosidase